MFDTVKLTVPGKWNAVKITQGTSISYAEVIEADGERYILANITPDKGEATLESIAKTDVPAEMKPEVKPTPDITTTNPSIPDVYTFDTLDGYLGTLITFNNEGVDTNKLLVATEGENKVLKMEKSAGQTQSSVTILGKTATGASSFVAETKIKLNRTSSSGETYINLMDSNGKFAYRAYVYVNSDKTLQRRTAYQAFVFHNHLR